MKWYFTFQDRAELTYEGHAPGAEVLADGHLLEEDGDAAEDHGDEVDDQKRTWSWIGGNVNAANHLILTHPRVQFPAFPKNFLWNFSKCWDLPVSL